PRRKMDKAALHLGGLEIVTMTDVNTVLESADAVEDTSQEQIQVPQESSLYAEPDPNQDVIVVKRSTMYNTMFVVILLVGVYVVGWFMGSNSGGTVQAVRTAVTEAMFTAVAGLPSNPGSVAAQPQQPPTEDPNQRFTVSAEGNPAIGPENAPVTMIEFGDFQCPFCKRFHDETLSPLLKKYEGKIRFVYRDFPISSIHPFAQGAAEAAECAYEQKKFWEYHDLLFQKQPQLAKDDLLTYAKQLNLDMKAFQACIDSGKYAQEVQSDYQTGLQLGVNGTPTFYINGRRLIGAMPTEAFTALIDAELAAADSSAGLTPTIPIPEPTKTS